jgi:hypothetical protein
MSLFTAPASAGLKTSKKWMSCRNLSGVSVFLLEFYSKKTGEQKILEGVFGF